MMHFTDLLDGLEGMTVRYDLARSYAMPENIDDLPDILVDGVLYWQALLAEYCAAVAGWPDGTHRIPFVSLIREMEWQDARGKYDKPERLPVPAKIPPLTAEWYTNRYSR